MYAWSNGNSNQDLTGLAAGTYTVTVTDDVGCIQTAVFVVTEPAVLVATETHINPVCPQSNTGLIDISVSGGVAPYIFME